MKIKVIEIIADSTFGGGARHLFDLVTHLDKKKFEIIVICPAGDLARKLQSFNLKCQIVSMKSKFDLGAIFKIRKILKVLSTKTIVHCHGLRAGFLARLAAIGLPVKILYTEHLWTKDYHLPNPINEWLQLFSLWFLDLFTTKTIAVSRSVADFLIKRGITRSEKVVVIYNGIKVKVKVKSQKLKQKSKTKKIIVGSVGGLNFQKGYTYLIEAADFVRKVNPFVSFQIVGAGPLERELKLKIKKKKLEKKFKILKPTKEIEEKMRDWDIYVQPSLSESFGYAILQAMSQGLAVIASEVGGIPELVEEGKSGILVSPRDSSSLSRAIIRLINDPAQREKMAKSGQNRVKNLFSLEKMVEKTSSLYSKIGSFRD